MTKTDRIETLENQLRSLKRILIGSACVLIAMMAIAASDIRDVPEVVKAKQFVVVNDQEEVLAVLGATKGSGSLFLLNQKSLYAVGLGVEDGAGELILSDGSGIPVALLPEDENRLKKLRSAFEKTTGK